MLLKSEDKQNLYYNKYKYKATVRSPNLNLIQWCSTFEDFMKKLGDSGASRFQYRRAKDMTWTELHKTESIINFRNRIKKRFDVTTRQEHDTLGFYSNDLDLLKEIWAFSPDSTITEVNVMPAGVLTFAREPKHQYRVYLKGDKISLEMRDDLTVYLHRTNDAHPCNALKCWLIRDYRHPYLYSNEKHFIDYDEPAVLTMLHLICPKLVGKSYKLERK